MEDKVSLSLRARRDLADIWHFIAKDDSDAAGRFCRDMALYTLTLKTFPERGPELRNRPDIRKIPFQNYLIFYRIDAMTRSVEILRFWHAARSQNHLRLKEEALSYATAVSSLS